MTYLVMALRGRLGNNLWQFASGLGFARALDARLCFDCRRVPEPVRFLPQLLGANYQEATPAELRRVGVASLGPGPRAGVTRFALRHAVDYQRRALRRSPAEVIRYRGADAFGKELFDLDLPLYLAGYFQDEQNFSAVADQVADALRWPDGTISLPEELGVTVAVSFRRADFNLFDAGLPLDYYDRAMQLLRETVGDATFVLFGDDPVFVELFAERAQHKGYPVVSALTLGPDPITQLRLQSECDHAILANSTFAWWGAWLGDRRLEQGRMVIAPASFGSRLRSAWIPLEEVEGVTTTYDLTTFGPSAALS